MPIVKPVGLAWVWHARHAGHEIGKPSMVLMFAPASYTDIHIIAKYILGNLRLQVSCLAINADYNKKVMFVIMYVTGSTGKTEDRSF